MKYEHARALICTGDCVAVSTRTWGGAIIRFGQRVAGLRWHHYSHVGIAVSVVVAGEMRMCVAEMNQGGNNYRPLSQFVYDGCDVAIFEPPPGTDMQGLASAIRDAQERHIPYGWLDLVPIGIQLVVRRFRGPVDVGGDGGADRVCSFFAKLVYLLAGGRLPKTPYRPAPAELLEDLTLKLTLEA